MRIAIEMEDSCEYYFDYEIIKKPTPLEEYIRSEMIFFISKISEKDPSLKVKDFLIECVKKARIL